METKGLPILHCEKPKILLLGTLPGKKSSGCEEYYSDKRNRFWKIIAALHGIEQVPSDYKERKKMLDAVHISLWDVYKEGLRTTSLDKDIKYATLNGLENELRDHPQIDIIAFNGGKASECIPSIQEEISTKLPNRKIKYVSLPSSSGANRKYSIIKDLIKVWKEKLLG